MTKKVTGNDLKNLIKEVLSENIDIKIDKASWGKAKKSAGLTTVGSIGAKTSAKGLEKLLDLTGVDGDETDLTDDDLKRATGDTKTTADKWFTNSSKRPSGFADLDAYVTSLGGSPPAQSKSQLKKDILAACADIKAKNDTHHKKAEKLLVDLKALYSISNPSDRTAYGQALKEIASAIARLRTRGNPSAGDIKLAPITAAMIDNGMDISRGVTQSSTINPFGGVDFTQGTTDASGLRTSDTADEQGRKITAGFAAQEVKLPSNIVNAMKLFEDKGTDLGNRLQSLEETANSIKNSDYPSSAGGKLKFAAKANVLISLTNLAKVTDSSSAGFAFEKFICAFFNGIGAGGANGAIDVALKAGAGWVPSSAKFLSGGNVEQAGGDAGEIGVEGILNKYGKIIYFVFQKVKDKTGKQRVVQASERNDYSKIQVYITMVYKDKNVEVMVLDSSGNATYRDTGVPAPTGGLSIAFKNLRGTNLGNPTATLPVLNSPDSAANSIAEFAKAQMTDNGGIFDQLMGIFGLLENMKKNTENYETTGGEGGTSPAQGLASTEYLAELSKDYIDAKDMYATLFTDAGEDVTGTGFAEGKVITASFLKKLISESFKS
jgi:hypothetical protein